MLEGRAAEFEREIPFGVVLDAMNDYLGSLEPAQLREVGDETVAELAPIFPALARLGKDPPSPRLPAERYRVHYALRALLEALTAQRPVVLALDDLHWADEASIETIAHLLRRFSGPLLGVVAARRPVARLATGLELRERLRGGVRLELAPLSRAEADALIGPGHDPATRAALYRQSGGNPFYLEELDRAAGMGLSLAEDWSASGLGGVAPPPGVAAAISGELAELSDDARSILHSAAIAGESFEPELLSAIASTTESAALDGLDQLVAADLVRSTEAPRVFRFRHPIVRRVVYDGMPAGWRLGAHARAAAALEAAGVTPAARAHHVERSARRGDEASIELLVDAARAAATRAPLTAGRWLRTALRLLAPDAPLDRRLELLAEGAGAFSQAGEFEESLEMLEHAVAIVPGHRTSDRAALVVQIAAAKRETGHPLESRALLERALDAVRATDPTAALALRSELVIDRFYRGDFAPMEQLAVTVRDDARSSGDDLLACLGDALASIAALSQGRIDRGRDHLARAQAGFEALSDERLVARLDLCGWVGLAALRLERAEQALEPVARGIALARATGQGSTFPGLLTLQCRALLAAGRVTEANRVAEAATDAATLTGNDNLVIAASEAAAMASMWAGEPESALESARAAVACSARIGDSYFAPLADLALAAALHANGDAAAARAELASLDSARARELLELSGAYGLELLTRVDLELGELDAAAEASARAEVRACEVGLPLHRVTAGCASAAVLLAQGRAKAAARTGAAAATGAERAGNPLLAGRAHALAGIALASAGDRDAGIAALERALALLTACGAAGEAQRAARELRRLGRPVARSRRSATGKSRGTLSPREREVADHVAVGETNREVAAALFLSEKTIESHLSRIYEKLGIHSRSALAATVARTPALSGRRDDAAP